MATIGAQFSPKLVPMYSNLSVRVHDHELVCMCVTCISMYKVCLLLSGALGTTLYKN